jgi:Leucine-rich repeat (LRR) protein
MDFVRATDPDSTCFLFRLPRDVLFFISNYFLEKEDQNKKIFQFCYDWQNFMCTNKQHFGQWKMESRIVVLKKHYVKLYYDSAEFRERVLRSIVNPRLQLELVFSYETFPHSSGVDLQLFNHVKRIAMFGIGDHCHIVPNALDVDRLELFSCTREDLSPFRSVKHLTLSPHKTINDNKIFDLSPLIGLESGWFKVYHCVNYHSLASLKSLEIQYCDSIVDVSCFRNIPTLSLISCPNITDVSPLANVRYLTLRGCQGIADVSSLGRVHSLDLTNCQKIRDVSSLKDVHTLDITRCWQVLDFSGLENVYSFRKTDFPGKDLSGMKNVVILDISDANGEFDITMLRSLKELSIGGDCKLTQGLSGIVHLEKLSIDSKNFLSIINKEAVQLPKLRQLELSFIQPYPFCEFDNSFWIESSFLLSLKSLQKLHLLECNTLESLPSLPGLQSLTIDSCENFQSLPIFTSLGYLDISYCENLTVLEILGSAECKFPIYSVLVRGCDELTRFTIDRTIFRCQLALNDKLEIIEVNQQVGHLKIDPESTVPLKKITNQSLVVSLKFIGSEKDPHYQINKETDEINL